MTKTHDLVEGKKRFEKIFNENIKREGSEKLFDFLLSSDFFTAPASTRYHNSFEGGLMLHSLNVYDRLVSYLSRPEIRDEYKLNYSDETVALVSLMHDLCKTNVYVVDYRNVKNEQGNWEKVPYYKYEDNLPYGHGEKSVYMMNGFLKLTREESMAIRWHMGFSGTEDKNIISNAFEKYPLAFALSIADMEASFFIEK